MTEHADVVASLAALRAKYAARLGAALSELAQLVSGQDVSRAIMEEARVCLHRLAGSGGTFGFPELSQRALALEQQLGAWLAADVVPASAEWECWHSEMMTLSQNLGPNAQVSVTAPPVATPRRSTVHIVLLDDDLDLGADLCRGLSQFGYQASHFSGVASARDSVLARAPDVLLLDMNLTGELPPYGTVAAAALYEELGQRVPTIYFSAANDYETRLLAAKSAGDAFLVKPIQIPELVDSIENLLYTRHQQAYRVLIVDDDELLAEHYRLTLSAVGLSAKKVCRANDALAALEEFEPDLVLLDLYMPGCSGADLARAIRYDPKWQSLPVIFLSAETNLYRQTEALDAGADDFLTKPVADDSLVAIVTAKVARARRIADLIGKDSLTGLLTHASISQRMDQSIVEAHRVNQPTSIVVIDIDHFMWINEAHGHQAGEQVIKTLAHLLRLSLREQDSIGRYRGEEFVAVLPHCPAAEAQKMLDDGRQRFSGVVFTCNGESFTLTLSAGVVCSEDWQQELDLIAPAIVAVQAAKAGGRNRVQISQHQESPLVC